MAPPTTTDQAAPDASTGFHDIKPLPEFNPISTLWFLPLAVLLAYALYRWWKKKADAPRVRPSIPQRDPLEVALERLSRLEQQISAGAISVREFAVSLSLILRTCWQNVLHFEATEQTVGEVAMSLPSALQSSLRATDQQALLNYAGVAVKILRFCERAAFADDAEQVFTLGSEKVNENLNASRTALETLSLWVKNERREEERRAATLDVAQPARRVR